MKRLRHVGTIFQRNSLYFNKQFFQSLLSTSKYQTTFDNDDDRECHSGKKKKERKKKITVVNHPFSQVEKPNSLKQTRTHDNSSQSLPLQSFYGTPGTRSPKTGKQKSTCDFLNLPVLTFSLTFSVLVRHFRLTQFGLCLKDR